MALASGETYQGGLVRDNDGRAVVTGTTQRQTSFVQETTTPLAANGVFNGPERALDDWDRFRAYATSNVAGTLNIQQRHPGGTWRITHSVAVAAGAGVVLEGTVFGPLGRVQYVNGATAQTSFETWSALIG